MPDSAFGFENAEDSPGFLLWQTTITWQRHIKKALAPYNISHAQFVILAMVQWFDEHQEESTQINIARLSKLDKMTVSQSLKKLASMELATREEHQQDTRAKKVTLTQTGKELIRDLVPVVEGVDEQFFRTLNPTAQKSLIHLLRELVAQ